MIRNPMATRPWQHVLDCLYGYLLVAQSHFDQKSGVPPSINFGPNASLSVMELVELFEGAFEKKVANELLNSSIPEQEWLELDSRLAQDFLGWNNHFSPSQAVLQTANWYANFTRGGNPKALMRDEISEFRYGKW
jgi:CDP-glucose 4,6-dehydratase